MNLLRNGCDWTKELKQAINLWLFILLLPYYGLTTTVCSAQEALQDTLSSQELKLKNLEELMQMDVTSVSKHGEKLFETPAAVQIVTQEDIVRSGVTTLPEALRLAPNLNTAQVDSRQWAISARGFNETTANKLLVLIDGRSVYTPLYSGVFWDVQNVFLQDVARIEVVSGPGGTLWGANAVNGVINVIQKSSRDLSSQGMQVYAGTGTTDQAFGGIRYGGNLGEQASYRVYGMYFDRDNSKLSTGMDASDAWKLGQGGFRTDWDVNQKDALVMEGDFYNGTFDQQANDNTLVSGGNILGRWTRSFSEESNIETQVYFDRTHRNIPKTFGEDLDTYDVDFQHRLGLNKTNNFTWGVGFRYTVDDVENSPFIAFLPPHLDIRLYNGFLQDEIMLIENTLTLTLGSKFEHNDFSGFEVQPSARISWSAAFDHFVWASISRAVRTPSRIDQDFFAPANPPYLLAGGPNFDSEKLIAYEAGYRFSSHSITFDVATFYNNYDDLRSIEPGPPYVISNGLAGTSYGAEIVLNYQVADWWRLRSGYSFFQKDIDLKSWSMDINNGQSEGNDAKHRVKIHSLMNVSKDLELDAWLRIVSDLPDSSAPVPGFVSLDLRVAVRATKSFTFSVVGQNLLQDRHPEFGSPSMRNEIERSVLGRIDWSF